MMVPTFWGFEMLAAGKPKLAVFVALKASARNCRRKRSVMPKVFASEKSIFRSQGPLRMLRPELP